MPKIKLSAIVIDPNRQRQEFDPEALQELKTSIEDGQLMHPPVLRPRDGQMVLVAGERRLKAIEDIFALGGCFVHNGELFKDGMVPYTDIGELTELEAEEAELDENLKRRDLTWQELAAAHNRLHELRKKQSEAALEKAVDSGELTGLDASQVAEKFPKPTIAQTATEIYGRGDGSFSDKLRKETIVAKHLDNPEVAAAKDVNEAFKILKRQEQQKKNSELAASVGLTFRADLHELYHTDCLQYMRDAAHEQFDVILTDPPYGMDAQDFGDAGGKMTGIEHHYDDSHASWTKLMSEFAPLSYAVAKPKAHAYVFCDFDNFHELKALMQSAGWYVFRTPLVLHKLNSGRVPRPEHGPRRQYELVLYAIKGDKTVTHIYPDVFSVQGDENLGHGAQKPVAAYQNLLQRSVQPGDRVFDPFCGTGTIFPAAHELRCVAVGCELNTSSYGIGVKRLQSLKAMETPGLF
ncbi:adenine specific methyltransferase mboiiA [Bacteriophage sp.]|nr:adenine specific methyltransferase mboiiA [Bacteriophage sp.]